LASRAVRGEPVFPFSAALRAAESVGKIPESLILVHYLENSSNIFCRRRRQKFACLNWCGSPRRAGLAAFFDNFKFFYELIITHFRKFFKQKFSDLAANYSKKSPK